MAVATYLFFGDLCHKDVATTIITASGTAAGYSVDAVRDTNLLTSWKDVDSTTNNIWLRADGTTTTWLGAGGDSAYVAIAYDARDNEQNTLKLEYGTVDDGAFAAVTVAATFTLTKGGTGPQCAYTNFSIPATPKRYWRLIGYGNERTEAAGDNVPKIYAWSMYDKDTVFRLGAATPYAGDDSGQGRISPITRTGVAKTAVGALATNRYAEYGMSFETNFQPASIDLWQGVRDQLGNQGGPNRANFVQHEGLRNGDVANFFMCRVQSNEYPSMRNYVDVFESGIPWETEPWL